ncbi:hypothetical protein VN4201_14410 [Helicobacter pylori]|nr:hypothetical protein VN0228_14360 [Helicobacter pylori]
MNGFNESTRMGLIRMIDFEAKARDNPSQVAPSHTDITRDARGNNLLLDDDYR